MREDLNKRHIETEKKFYSIMNKKRSLLLSSIFAGIGSIILYIQYWQVKCNKITDLWLWILMVGIIFIALTLVGYFIFEYERVKYTEKR
jgi:hypothetical protein